MSDFFGYGIYKFILLMRRYCVSANEGVGALSDSAIAIRPSVHLSLPCL